MGTQLPQQSGRAAPHFVAYVYCGQTVAWIKKPLGQEVGLSPGDIVLDWHPAPPKMGTAPNFQPMSVMAKWLDG